MRIFIQIYHKESFAKVAKDYNLAPSSITRTINHLEKELGLRLFQRTTRSVTPTIEGKRYLERIEPLIEELEQVQNDLAFDKKGLVGTLRMTSPSSFSQVHLSYLIPEFLESHPHLNVELVATDSVIDLVSERIDLAIRFGELKESSFISTKFASLDYIVCASPKYIKRYGLPNKPSEIGKHKTITFLMPRFRTNWLFKKNGKISSFPINTVIAASSGLTQKEMALQGTGLTLLPKLLISEELKSKKLINVFPDHEVAANSFTSAAWIVYPTKQYMPQKTRAFIDFLKSKNFD